MGRSGRIGRAACVAGANAAAAPGLGHQSNAGIADLPLLAVGKRDVLHPPAGVQAVAGGIGAGQQIALRHPGQAGAGVQQALALALQGHAVSGLQHPARCAGEHRAQHRRCAALRGQRLSAGGQREAQGLGRGAGLSPARSGGLLHRLPQAGRHLQPDAGPVQPRRHRAQRRQPALVGAEPGIEHRQLPIAQVLGAGR